jgi:hypothetical protein
MEVAQVSAIWEEGELAGEYQKDILETIIEI